MDDAQQQGEPSAGHGETYLEQAWNSIYGDEPGGWVYDGTFSPEEEHYYEGQHGFIFRPQHETQHW